MIIGMVEDHIREVTVGHGIVVSSFYDPPLYPPGHALHETQPVKRWRVRLPDWFPEGSWLSRPHAYASLEDAVNALEESGARATVDEYWDATRAVSHARQVAFAKIMTAFNRRDDSYDEILRSRHNL